MGKSKEHAPQGIGIEFVERGVVRLHHPDGVVVTVDARDIKKFTDKKISYSFEMEVLRPIIKSVLPEETWGVEEEQTHEVELVSRTGGLPLRRETSQKATWIWACANLVSKGVKAEKIADEILRTTPHIKPSLELDPEFREDYGHYHKLLTQEILKYYPGNIKR